MGVAAHRSPPRDGTRGRRRDRDGRHRRHDEATPPPRPLTLADLLRGRFYGGPTLRVDQFVLRRTRATAAAPARGLGAAPGEHRGGGATCGLGRGVRIQSSTRSRCTPCRAPKARALGSGSRPRFEDGRLGARSLVIRGAGSALDASAILAVDRRDSIGEGARRAAREAARARRPRGARAGSSTWTGPSPPTSTFTGPRLDRASGSIAASAERVRVGDLAFATTRLDGTFADGRADAKLVTR